MAIAMTVAEKVDELLPTLYEMVTDGLIEVQDTTVVKTASKDKPAPEPKPSHERKAGTAKMMRIFLGEADRWNDEPLYDALFLHQGWTLPVHLLLPPRGLGRARPASGLPG